MTKFFNKFKKTYFLPILSLFFPFFGQKCYFKKSSSVTTTHGPVKPCCVSKKKLISQSRESFQTEVQKDGQTLIHTSLPAIARGPTSTTALDHI